MNQTSIAWTQNPDGTPGFTWCHARLFVLCVLLLMTSVAKGDPIGNDKAQFRVSGEWFQMVGIQIASSGIAASLAGEGVAREHIEAPPLVSLAEPISSTFGEPAILERMAFTASRSSDACDGTDERPGLDGVLDPGPRMRQSELFSSGPSCAHFCPCLSAHRGSLFHSDNCTREV